jgi:uncharacterized protein YjdB
MGNKAMAKTTLKQTGNKMGRALAAVLCALVALTLMPTGLAQPEGAYAGETTTVSTPAELAYALANAQEGDTISITGDIGSTTDYHNYSVTEAVSITGGGPVYGNFTVYEDGVTFDGISVETPQVPYQPTSGADQVWIYGIGGIASDLTVVRCNLSVNDDMVIAGNSDNGYLYSGIRIMPISNTLNYTFRENTINGVQNDYAINGGIIIGPGGSDKNTTRWQNRFPLTKTVDKYKADEYQYQHCFGLIYNLGDIDYFNEMMADNYYEGIDSNACVRSSEATASYIGAGASVAGLQDAITYPGDTYVDANFELTSSVTLAEGNTLTIADGATITIAAGKALTIAESATLENNGTLVVAESATLTNQGTISNEGIVSNSGTVSNSGEINNSGTLENNSTLYNSGTVANEGVLINEGTIGGNEIEGIAAVPAPERIAIVESDNHSQDASNITVDHAKTKELTIDNLPDHNPSYQWGLATIDLSYTVDGAAPQDPQAFAVSIPAMAKVSTQIGDPITWSNDGTWTSPTVPFNSETVDIAVTPDKTLADKTIAYTIKVTYGGGSIETQGTIQVTPHACETVITKPATCTEDGEKVTTCTICGDAIKETIPALGHDWGEWTVTTPATETSEGVETRVCKHDPSHKETRAIAKLPAGQPLGDVDEQDEQEAAPAVIRAAVSAYAVVKGKSVTIPFVVDGGEAASAVSQDEGIAMVTKLAEGSVTVKGVKVGKTKVVVTTADGASKTFTVTVAKKAVKAAKVSVSDSKLKTSYTVKKGARTQVKTTLKGDVKWASSNSNVASVDKAGNVKAKKVGTAKITAKAGGKTQTFKVKVVKNLPEPKANVTVKNPPKSMKVGETQELDVRVSAKNTPTGAGPAFKSSKPGVLEVDAAGQLTAKAPGKAKVTVTAGGKTASFTVTVK